jgi:hypothetical protein
LENYTTAKGIWNGWYYRLIGIVVLAVAILQVLAQYLLKNYPIIMTVPVAIVIVAYLIIPRIRERRLGNAILGVVAAFVVDVILEFVLPLPNGVHFPLGVVVQSNALALVMGIVLAYLYLKLTIWSEKKRLELEQKRQENMGTPTKPPVRHHRKKKKKRR